MCGIDFYVYYGFFLLFMSIVVGYELIGQIVEVGVGVIEFCVGDRVGVFWN